MEGQKKKKKKVVLSEKAKQLTKEQVGQYREAFDLFDKNKDNYISLNEMKICVDYFGMNYTTAELKEHLNCFDQDGNGKIDFTEYLNLVSDESRKENVDKEEVLDAFKMFDKDEDGFISAMELRNAMLALGNKMTQAELNEMLAAADFNRDGKICYDEFTTMMFS